MKRLLNIIIILLGLSFSTVQTQALGNLTLTWSPSSGGPDGYKIERALAATGTFVQVAQTGNVTTWVDIGLPDGTWFYYRVRAFNLAGDSGYSNIAGNQTPSVPSQVAGVSAVLGTNLPLRSIVSWTAVSGATNYNVRRIAGTTTNVFVAGNTTSYIDSTVAIATVYSYSVSAVNSVGAGSYSVAASVTTPSIPSAPVLQPITVSRLGNGYKITWPPEPNALYIVKSRVSDTDSWKTIATIKGVGTYTDKPAKKSTQYQVFAS